MSIDVSYAELLDIVNALRARADLFKGFKSMAPDATRSPEYWQEEAANHLGARRSAAR
jgi:hypothetical protein